MSDPHAKVLSRQEIKHAIDVVGGFDERIAQTLAHHIAGLERHMADGVALMTLVARVGAAQTWIDRSREIAG